MCWKPLQPPPTTRMRRYSFSVAPAACWSATIRLTSSAAFSVMVMAGAAGAAGFASSFRPSVACSLTVDMVRDSPVRVIGLDGLYRGPVAVAYGSPLN